MANRTTFTVNETGRKAIKAFRDSKPWQGTIAERIEKFRAAHRGLCRAYDLETMLDCNVSETEFSSGGSHFDPRKNRIVLTGRLSVVTYLFLFGLAVGLRRAAAMTWARETFAHFFPRSFSRCKVVDGLVVKITN